MEKIRPAKKPPPAAAWEKALNAEIESSGRAANSATTKAWSKLAFRARGVLIGSAASIPITHFTPFNQHRLFLFHQIGPCLVSVNDLFHDLGELSVGGGVLEDLRRPAKNFAAAAHWRRRSGGSIRFPGASPLM